MKVILFVILQIVNFIDCNSLQNIKQRPIFSDATISSASQVVIPRNISLASVILVVEAATYKEAQPIVFSILENTEHFRINPVTGFLYIYSPLMNQTRVTYHLTVIATDSAPIDSDKQSSYLSVNIEIVDLTNAPIFSAINPYFVTVSELVEPNSIIYNRLEVYDMDWRTSTDNSTLKIYCDSSNTENSDTLLSCQQFSIECNIFFDNNYRCNIRLLQQLNFYSKPNYIITITAQNNSTKSSINFVVDVLNSKASKPYFSRSLQVLYLDLNTPVGTNVYQLVVNNELNGCQDKYFSINDPYSFLKLNVSTFNCRNTGCSQFIQISKPLVYATEYSLEIIYVSFNAAITLKLFLVITQSAIQRAPAFSNQFYGIVVPENLTPGSVVKNTNIAVFETEYQTFYSSGFKLQLLNNDFITESNTFGLAFSYAKNKANVIIRLLATANLKFAGHSQYNLILKATSGIFISYTNLTIKVENSSYCRPQFQSPGSIVLNNPEVLKVNDVLAKMEVIGCSSPMLNFAILGIDRDWFWIDSIGRIYLLQPLFTSFDDNFYFNLTLSVSDVNGLTDFTNFVIFINTTSNMVLQQSIFSFPIMNPKSEISLSDNISLLPSLFVSANSVYNLKYNIISMVPNLTNLIVNENTGQLLFISPLDRTILTNYDKILVTVQALQYRLYESHILYLGSLASTVVIFFKNLNSIPLKPPYFLRNYYSIVDRENVYHNIPLIKPTAVSSNGNNQRAINYYLLNNSNLFSIDLFNGFIYPLKNLSLPINIYSLKVLAVDSTDNSESITNVNIRIVAKMDNVMACNADYLVIKVTENTFDPSKIYSRIGDLLCSSSSVFGDPSFQYSIGAPVGIYDCNGFEINYAPYLGIGSTNGTIYTYEGLTRKNFCDALYLINVFKDQTALFIPFHLVITADSNYGLPIFINYNTNIYVPNYAYGGSFISNILAYDQNQKQLIQNYSLLQNQYENYFNINSKSGVLTLNQPSIIPPISILPVTIVALAPNGLSSTLTLQIDLSNFVNTIVSIKLNSSLNNQIFLRGNTVYTHHIYSTSVFCNNRVEYIVPCGSVGFSLNFFNNSNFSNFAIDDSQNVFLTSPLVYDFQIQTKYVFIINDFLTPNILKRLDSSAYKEVSVIVEEYQSNIPRFEYPSYSIKILDTVPAGSIVLSIRYINDPTDTVDFTVEQVSNSQIFHYFNLRQSYQTISLYILSSPIINDKPDLSFSISMTSKNKQKSNYTATTKINIQLLTPFTVSNFPKFQQPFMPNEKIIIDFKSLMNDLVIYTFEATNTQTESTIEYKIINQENSNIFYIEKNNLFILGPIQSTDRTNFLLFIEAKDITYLTYSYTTLNVIIVNNTVTQTIAYFDPILTNGNFYINIYDNIAVKSTIYDISKLVTKSNNSPLYFYIFNSIYPYDTSSKFAVNPITKKLILLQPLNFTAQNEYKIFIYATNALYTLNTLNPATASISNIIFFYIKVLYSNKLPPYFLDYTKFIFVEPSYSVKTLIGYVRASNRDSIQLSNFLTYGFQTCSYQTYTNQETKDKSLCDIFYLSNDGNIYTNYQLDSFKKGYFTLTVYAMDNGYPPLNSTIESLVFFAKETEKARLIINIPADKYFNQFLDNLKNDINHALNSIYDYELLDYYFSYVDYSIPTISSSSIQIEVCFYLLKVQSYQFLTYQETYNLLINNQNVKNIFQYYSVSKIERCYDNDPYTPWKFDSLSIGIMILACTTLFFTILGIILLITCWTSHMKHALITRNMEFTDSSSNSNILVD